MDLTQPLTPDLPLWPGDPAFEVEAWASYDTDGYFINRIAIGEHSGTHWGTPNTFIEGARSAEMISVEELVVPAVVIDIREQAAQDADYRLTVEDVTAWEADNGEIPADSVAILFTGWQDKWGDSGGVHRRGCGRRAALAGFSAEAAAFLIEERGVVAWELTRTASILGNDEGIRRQLRDVRRGWHDSWNAWPGWTSFREPARRWLWAAGRSKRFGQPARVFGFIPPRGIAAGRGGGPMPPPAVHSTRRFSSR